MRRYYIRYGDKSTSGGIVTQGLNSFTIYGVMASYHGAYVTCPRCERGGGPICGDGPSRPFTLANRKQIALENDIILCGCDPKPRLIPSQNHAWMSFDGNEIQTWRKAAGIQNKQPEPGQPYNAHFVVNHGRSGQPLEYMFYTLDAPSGPVTGITGPAGKTDYVTDTSAATLRLRHLVQTRIGIR
jgi:hypothetical protein